MHLIPLWGFAAHFILPVVLLLLLEVSTMAMDVDSECNHILQSSPGEFANPNFPDVYPENKICQWTIIMPRYEKINLTFSRFDVKSGSFNNVCNLDYVEVIDGSASVGRFCNSHLPPAHILSSRNVVRVVFKSAQTGYRGTFLIKYYKNPCGGRLRGVEGAFQSPNYPNPYPTEKKCTWLVEVPSSKVIKLTFDTFDLNKYANCQLDFVKVRDGPHVTSKEIGHYCHKQSPHTVRSTGDKMSVEFSSFSDGEGQGFKARYEAVSHCGGSLSSDSGSFSSPGYPGSRPVHQDCVWEIQVSPQKIVSLTFDTFDVSTGLPSNDSCGGDHVAVYDGPDADARLLKKICTSLSEPLNIFSQGSKLRVELITSYANKGKGFFASYYAVSPDNHYNGCFKSANEVMFTCDNGHIVHCKWKCDGTDECGDHSDENNCPGLTEELSKKDNQLRHYVTIILSITGSALATVCIGCIVDRARRKHRSHSRRRRTHRLRHHRTSDTVPLTLATDPSTPPPPYEVAAGIGTTLHAIASVLPHVSQDGATEEPEVDASASVSVGRVDNVPMHTAVTNPSTPSDVSAVLLTVHECLTSSIQEQTESAQQVANQT